MEYRMSWSAKQRTRKKKHLEKFLDFSASIMPSYTLQKNHTTSKTEGVKSSIMSRIGVCFSYCWAVLTQSQGLFLLLSFSHHPTRAGWGCTSWEHTHSRDSWPQLTKGISLTLWCHAHNKKLVGEGRGERSERWCLSSQVTITHDGALRAEGWLNTCLLMGSSKWIPCSALLPGVAFALPVKLSFPQFMSFPAFTLPQEGSEGVAVWCLAASWG